MIVPVQDPVEAVVNLGQPSLHHDARRREAAHVAISGLGGARRSPHVAISGRMIFSTPQGEIATQVH